MPAQVVSFEKLEGRLLQIFEDLHVNYAHHGYNGRGKSFQILAQLYVDPKMRSICSQDLPVDTGNAEEAVLLMTQMALQIYAYQPGLTTLHAVTGGHALSDLLQYLPADAKAMSARLYWHWLSTLFVEKGSPQLQTWSDGGANLSANEGKAHWVELRKRALRPLTQAVESNMEDLGEGVHVHVLKLACTCEQMYWKKPHPLYLKVANFVVKNNQPW